MAEHVGGKFHLHIYSSKFVIRDMQTETEISKKTHIGPPRSLRGPRLLIALEHHSPTSPTASTTNGTNGTHRQHKHTYISRFHLIWFYFGELFHKFCPPKCCGQGVGPGARPLSQIQVVCFLLHISFFLFFSFFLYRIFFLLFFFWLFFYYFNYLPAKWERFLWKCRAFGVGWEFFFFF